MTQTTEVTPSGTFLAPLADVAQFAAYTSSSVLANDQRVQGMLTSVSAAVRRYCGWHIAPVITEELVLDGSGSDLVELPTMRVVEIQALTERCPWGAAAHEWSADELADLEWSALGTLRRRHGVWTDRYRGITVRLRHGFEDAPDLAQVVCQVAAMALSSPTGATHEQAGSVSISYGTTASGVAGGAAFLERDLRIMDAYAIRRP